jgi:hypothetical protein
VQGCDNQTSVGALQKGLSTKAPLSDAVQAMSVWESWGGMKTWVTYLPGEENGAADQLSRWRKKGLDGFNINKECHVTLTDVLKHVPLTPK